MKTQEEWDEIGSERSADVYKEMRDLAVQFEKHLMESGLGHLCSSPELTAKGLKHKRLMRELGKLLNDE